MRALNLEYICSLTLPQITKFFVCCDLDIYSLGPGWSLPLLGQAVFSSLHRKGLMDHIPQNSENWEVKWRRLMTSESHSSIKNMINMLAISII